MKIAIFADLHDNEKNLEKFLSWCSDNEAAELICCGDLTNGDTLKKLSEGFTGKIRLARGNMDVYGEDEPALFPNLDYLGRYGRVSAGGHDIGICHEPDFFPRVLALGPCAVIFYGHTHRPWIEKKKNVILANPGTLGAVFQKSTFAVWEPEAGKIELKTLDDI